jgi:hypothetical protein
MVALARRWLVHIGLTVGPASTVPSEEDDMFEDNDRTMLRELHSLATTGQRLGPHQTSGGGVPIANVERQFWEVDRAVSAVSTAVEDIKTRLELMAERDDSAPVGQVTSEQLTAVIQKELSAAFARAAQGPAS